MRLLPLLTATLTVNVLAEQTEKETAQDILADYVPLCMQSCVGNAVSNILGCPLNDNECICNAENVGANKAEQFIERSQRCVGLSNCTQQDAKQFASVDFQKVLTEGKKEVCSMFPYN